MDLDKSRRRSIVDVRRKSLVFDQIFSDDENLRVSTDSSKISMQDYVEELRREQNQWKDVLHSRKQLSKELRIKNASDGPVIIKEEDVEPYLTEEERAFLNGKPDYSKMLSDVKRYVDSIAYLNFYKSDIIKHYEQTVNMVEMKRKIVVDKMCANDLCEICNVRDCNDPNHQFPLA